VIEATTMISTMHAIGDPGGRHHGTPATARPRMAMTTVPPANTMTCPAVSTARPTDSSTGVPRARYSRCRVMRNSA
jgi:hypothetical protein